MAVVNFNYPKFKYTIASTGEPGVGYQLFTYVEGTSTKQTTWTSLDKSAENTNPIILDANGEADVWIDGDYKFVLALPADTDPPASPVWTYDAIRSSDEGASVSGAGDKPTNGSFEEDTVSTGSPDNWTLAVLSGGTIAIDSTTSTHGADSLKFTSTGSGGGTASTDDYYEVEASKDIGVRFSIISDDVDTLNKVQVFWYNSSQVFISSDDVYNDGATTPTTWTRQYTTVTAPATAKFARIVLTGVDAASTSHSNTCFDNIELDTSSTPTLLSETAGRRGALVGKTASQLVNDGSTDILTWDTEAYDTDNVHDNSTNNSRLTVPEGITKVKIGGSVAWTTNATGVRELKFTKNTTTTWAGFAGSLSNAPSFGSSINNIWTPVIEVVGGDYFEAKAFQNSGSNLSVSNADISWFAMEIIE